MALPLLLRGDKLSLLERNLSAGITASQIPDPLYPLSRLGDTRPSQLFIFPLRLEDEYFHIDVDQYRDAGGIVIGGFENWTDGIPDGHTVNVSGTGAVTEEISTPIFAGSSSMQMENGASGTAEVLASITVLAGDEVELRYASQTSVASSPATLEVFNPYTGKWLTTSGAWSSRRQNAIESVLTVMDEATLGFTVEAFSLVRNHEVALELRYHMDTAEATTTHHWDAVRWIPGVDFMSVHAHNMSAGIIPRLVSAEESLALVPVDRATRFALTTRITKTSDFSGIADGKEGTFSGWVNFTSTAAQVQHIILGNDGNIFRIQRNSGGAITVHGFNSTPVEILVLTSAGTYNDLTGYHHILASWDLANGIGQLVIDGVDDLAGGSTLTDDFIDYARVSPEWVIGAGDSGTTPMVGDIAEVWFSISHIDISDAVNVARFYTSSGKAAILGDSGELVTGTAPELYWKGDFAASLINASGNGDFDTVTGSLVDSVTLEAELTKQDVSFYTKLTDARFRQFWKFHMRGTNAVNPIETGLWNLAQSITPPWSPRLQDNREALRFPQTRAVVEASGEQWAIKKAKHPRRSARLRFNLKSTSQASFRDELLARTFGGAAAFVLVENQESSKVVHGRSSPDSEFVRRSVGSETVELIIEESSNGVSLP